MTTVNQRVQQYAEFIVNNMKGDWAQYAVAEIMEHCRPDMCCDNSATTYAYISMATRMLRKQGKVVKVGRHYQVTGGNK